MDEPTLGVDLPEDLSTVDDRGLASLQEKITKAFTRLNDKEKVSAADLAEMGALSDQMDLVRAESTARETAQADAEAERTRLAAKMGGETTEDEPSEPAATVAEVAPEATEDAPEAEEEETTEEEADVESPLEALAAAILNASSAKATGRKATRTVGSLANKGAAARTRLRQPGSNITITAAAGIDRVQMGATLDREQLGKAMHEKARMLPDAKGNGQRHLVASIEMNDVKNDARTAKGDTEIAALWAKATDSQSLVASGGWCSPSETVYDFACDFEAMPEMLDLPSITGNRGGLRYPTSPLLGDVLDDITSGFTWTEADDIAAAEPGGPTKPCYVIPCPEFDEVRLQAQGICVTAGNLMDRSWPENVQRNIDLVMTAHAHRMNSLRIAKVVAASTAVAPTVTDLSAAEAILASIELQIISARDQFFMSADQVLEVVLPRWTRTVIRRDLARRAGVTFNQVANSDITAFFTEIGARVQFVSDWQSMRYVPVAPAVYAGATTLPASVQALVYPAGSHVVLDGGSLDLGVVRDSTLNATNDFTAAWTEEFWNVVSRCFSLIVTIPICANGWTGAPNEIACPTA